jgi:hypothetical protein
MDLSHQGKVLANQVRHPVRLVRHEMRRHGASFDSPPLLRDHRPEAPSAAWAWMNHLEYQW